MKITRIFPLIAKYSLSKNDKQFQYKILKRIMFLKKKHNFANEINEIKKNKGIILNDLYDFFDEVEIDVVYTTLNYIIMLTNISNDFYYYKEKTDRKNGYQDLKWFSVGMFVNMCINALLWTGFYSFTQSNSAK